MSDTEAIIAEAVHGCTPKEIAAAHGISINQVKQILDEAADAAFAADELRRKWFLEATRLSALGQKFYDKAMADGDVIAAAIAVKVSERLSTLTGINAPQSLSVAIHAVPPGKTQTSTDKVRSILDGVLGISYRERQCSICPSARRTKPQSFASCRMHARLTAVKARAHRQAKPRSSTNSKQSANCVAIATLARIRRVSGPSLRL
jgi:hypothetical protein